MYKRQLFGVDGLVVGLSEFINNGGETGVVGRVTAGRRVDSLNCFQKQSQFGRVAFRRRHEADYIAVSYTHLDVYKRQPLRSGPPMFR